MINLMQIFRCSLIFFSSLTIINVHAQKSTIAFEFGLNHSGFEAHSPFFPFNGNGFNRFFNPNLNLGISFDLNLRKRCFLNTGLIKRNTGSMYTSPIVTQQFPDGTGEFEKNKFVLKQVNVPLVLNYAFGDQFQIKPCIGLSINYKYSEFTKTDQVKHESHVSDAVIINALVGIILQKHNIWKNRFGLGVKCNFEYGLLDNGALFPITNTQVMSCSILGTYTLK